MVAMMTAVHVPLTKRAGTHRAAAAKEVRLNRLSSHIPAVLPMVVRMAPMTHTT